MKALISTIILLNLILSNPVHCQDIKLIIKNLTCKDVTKSESGKDEILVRIQVKNGNTIIAQGKAPIPISFWEFRRGDKITDIEFFKIAPPINDTWNVVVEFIEVDGVFTNKEKVIGRSYIDMTFKDGLLVKSKWLFDYDIYAVMPFPFGQHSYGCSIFGEESFYEAALLINQK